MSNGRIVISHGSQPATPGPSVGGPTNEGQFAAQGRIGDAIGSVGETLLKIHNQRREALEQADLSRASLGAAKAMQAIDTEFQDIDDFDSAYANYQNRVGQQREAFMQQFKGSEEFMGKVGLIFDRTAFASSARFQNRVYKEEGDYRVQQISKESREVYTSRASDLGSMGIDFAEFQHTLTDQGKLLSSLAPFLTEAEMAATKAEAETESTLAFILGKADSGIRDEEAMVYARSNMEAKQYNALSNTVNEKVRQVQVDQHFQSILTEFGSSDRKMFEAVNDVPPKFKDDVRQKLRDHINDREFVKKQEHDAESNRTWQQVIDLTSRHEFEAADSLALALAREDAELQADARSMQTYIKSMREDAQGEGAKEVARDLAATALFETSSADEVDALYDTLDPSIKSEEFSRFEQRKKYFGSQEFKELKKSSQKWESDFYELLYSGGNQDSVNAMIEEARSEGYYYLVGKAAQKAIFTHNNLVTKLNAARARKDLSAEQKALLDNQTKVFYDAIADDDFISARKAIDGLPDSVQKELRGPLERALTSAIDRNARLVRAGAKLPDNPERVAEFTIEIERPDSMFTTHTDITKDPRWGSMNTTDQSKVLNKFMAYQKKEVDDATIGSDDRTLYTKALTARGFDLKDDQAAFEVYIEPYVRTTPKEQRTPSFYLQLAGDFKLEQFDRNWSPTDYTAKDMVMLQMDDPEDYKNAEFRFDTSEANNEVRQIITNLRKFSPQASLGLVGEGAGADLDQAVSDFIKNNLQMMSNANTRKRLLALSGQRLSSAELQQFFNSYGAY